MSKRRSSKNRAGKTTYNTKIDAKHSKDSNDLKKVDGVSVKVAESDKDSQYNNPYYSDIDEKGRKLNKENINTRIKTMKRQNTFDKIYNTIMEMNDINADIEDFDSAGDDAGFEDESDSADEITISLPRDVAKQLCDVLNATVGGGMEDEFEDDSILDDGDETLEDAIQHDPDLKPAPGASGHLKHSDGSGKRSNKANASGYGVKNGKAQSPGPKSEPTPKDHSDSKGESLIGKSNRVKAPGYASGDSIKA